MLHSLMLHLKSLLNDITASVHALLHGMHFLCVHALYGDNMCIPPPCTKDCGGCDYTLSKSGPRITHNMDWIWIYPRGLDKSTHAHMHKTAQFLL